MRYLFCIFFLPISVFALYNGNPSFPMMPEGGIFTSKDNWFGVKAGYEFDDVYDRKLHRKGHAAAHIRKKVEKYDSLSNFGVLTLNFNQRVEIYSPLGAMSCEITQIPLSGTRITYHTLTHFAWGIGGRIILAYYGDLQIGVNASYVQANLPLSTLQMNGRALHKQGANAHFREWQVGAAISYRVNWFIPYIGLDFSDLRTRIVHLKALKSLFPNDHVTFKESYTTGIVMGFGLTAERVFNLNFEARVINENAVTVSADFKF